MCERQARERPGQYQENRVDFFAKDLGLTVLYLGPNVGITCAHYIRNGIRGWIRCIVQLSVYARALCNMKNDLVWCNLKKSVVLCRMRFGGGVRDVMSFFWKGGSSLRNIFVSI